MSYEIIEVTSSRELRKFINYPYRLYKGNPFYVPPLKSNEQDTLRASVNPAYDHCVTKFWLALKDDKVVGRIAGILNHSYISKWGKQYMRFGWFDFQDDQSIAADLLEQVELWALHEDMEAVHGPFGFTNFDPAGVLVEGFDQLSTTAELYNYPYYPIHIERAGYRKEVDWVEYRINVPPVIPKKIEQIANIVRRRNGLALVTPKSKKELAMYIRPIFALINDTYCHLHGMVPFTEKQVQYYIKKYVPFFREDYTALVIDSKGELIAFAIAIPSLSRALQRAGGTLFPWGLFAVMKALRTSRECEMCLVAVRPDYHGKGVNALLMEQIHKAFILNKIDVAESNPELENNVRVQSIWTYYEATLHKRRRCYIKHLR